VQICQADAAVSEYLVQWDSVDDRLNHSTVSWCHYDLVWPQPQWHMLLMPYPLQFTIVQLLT